MKSLIALLFAFAAITTLHATDLSAATELFKQGNAAYEKGSFEEAAAAYQKAEDLGVANARLYYNHGNALFRLNQLGPAILSYERARKLAPLDEDIAANLRFAQARVVDKIPEPERNVLTKILWGLHSAYSLHTGVWIAFGLFALAFAGVCATLLLATSRWLFITLSTISVLALLAFSPSLFYKIHQQESEQYGIVLSQSVEMYSGPGENYQVLAKVHEGTRFEIVELHGEWLSVKLANGKGGYVKADRLGKV